MVFKRCPDDVLLRSDILPELMLSELESAVARTAQTIWCPDSWGLDQ
jgi:hypothetical protein